MRVARIVTCILLVAMTAPAMAQEESNARPQPALSDLRILDRADGILLHESKWLPSGERDCVIEAEKQNLFCALAYANAFTLGEYQHRAAAMQAVRFAIEDQVDTSGYAHRLQDYNNAEGRTFAEVKQVIAMARADIVRSLLENDILSPGEAEAILNVADPSAVDEQ
ncbi:MAG: hypothetical protein AAGA69_01805 [Pseudomonadota bacterium]